ncbi:unnamed protein product [Rhizophagus irregularis]|nr:unnamed protein product [Rhizophagus irregularis]
MTKTGAFDLKLAWKTVGKVDPITWWKGNFETSAPELCKVAVRILAIPSSSAASERNWSNFSYIHEKKRNRLTDERVLKLVYIYSNYKLNCPRQESTDTMEAVIRFNNRPIQQNLKDDVDLLDPINNSNDLNEENDEILMENYEELPEIYSDFKEIDSDDEINNEEIDSEDE